jgi:tRNA-dihydrouridine synthase A
MSPAVTDATRAASPAAPSPWRLSVAPMMDWTDRHCRHFHRILSPHARLYTEMVNAHAIRHGDRERLLGFDAGEHPVALQLGGSDPVLLAEAARVGEDWGYDEINLNCGCPSDRVQAGRFGACLMREPSLVADCVAAMRAAVRVPVTVKCRIGVDDQDDDADLQHFIDTVRGAGCGVFVVHARKAWLKGLSPKENRDVPPLNYPRVHRLRADFPDLTLVLNGGLTAIGDCVAQADALDGVMLGRAAYHEPWILAQLERALFADGAPPADRIDALRGLRGYTEARLARGEPLAQVTRHVLGLFQGLPGARRFRRVLSEEAHRRGADWSVVERALQAMKETALAA